MNQDTALIIGNGPSVDLMDPAILDRVPSYGANQIYVKFAEWGRQTDKIVIADPTRLREIGTALKSYTGELYVGDARYVTPPAREIRAILGRDFIPVPQLAKRQLRLKRLFSRVKLKSYWKGYVLNLEEMSFDLEQGLRFAGSVVIPMIQLAAAQGYRKILLTGVDANIKPDSVYFNGLEKKLLMPSRDMPYNIRMTIEPALVLLQVYFEDMGIELIDCTPGGALRFITKGRLEDY